MREYDQARNEISGGIFFSAVIQVRDITVQLPPQVTPALSGLPAASPSFTGRGLAGVGKTELAVQAAGTVRERDWYQGGTLFVDLFGYDPGRIVDAAAALEGFLRALGIPGEHIPAAEQDRARLYTSVLAAYAAQGRPILVVIDNASAHEQVKPLLPGDGGCAAIATWRDTLGMLHGRVLKLDVLASGSSVAMLDQAIAVARPADTRSPGKRTTRRK